MPDFHFPGVENHVDDVSHLFCLFVDAGQLFLCIVFEFFVFEQSFERGINQGQRSSELMADVYQKAYFFFVYFFFVFFHFPFEFAFFTPGGVGCCCYDGQGEEEKQGVDEPVVFPPGGCYLEVEEFDRLAPTSVLEVAGDCYRIFPGGKGMYHQGMVVCFYVV